MTYPSTVDRVYVSTVDPTIVAYDPATFRVLATIPLDACGQVTSMIAARDGSRVHWMRR